MSKCWDYKDNSLNLTQIFSDNYRFALESEYLRTLTSNCCNPNRLGLICYMDNLAYSLKEDSLWQVDELSLTIYKKELNRIKPFRRKRKEFLDYDKEDEMIAKAQLGDEKARHEVIKNNLGYVMGIARRYQNHGLPLNDLIEEGNVGLIYAINKYDNSRGWSFRTYARSYIVGYILSALTKYGTLIHYSGCILQAYFKVNKYVNRFKLEKGHAPSDEDIAKYLNIDLDSIELVHAIHAIHMDAVSLDGIREYISDKDLYDEYINSSINALSSDLNSYEIDEEMYEESLSYNINECLELLHDREREIIKLRLGIGCSEHGLGEIAEQYNLTRERTRQIYEKAIRRLKAKREILVKYLID